MRSSSWVQLECQEHREEIRNWTGQCGEEKEDIISKNGSCLPGAALNLLERVNKTKPREENFVLKCFSRLTRFSFARVIHWTLFIYFVIMDMWASPYSIIPPMVPVYQPMPAEPLVVEVVELLKLIKVIFL